MKMGQGQGWPTHTEYFPYLSAGRILNISVCAADTSEPPRLLNYLTAPNVLVWSAVRGAQGFSTGIFVVAWQLTAGVGEYSKPLLLPNTAPAGGLLLRLPLPLRPPGPVGARQPRPCRAVRAGPPLLGGF